MIVILLVNAAFVLGCAASVVGLWHALRVRER